MYEMILGISNEAWTERVGADTVIGDNFHISTLDLTLVHNFVLSLNPKLSSPRHYSDGYS